MADTGIFPAISPGAPPDEGCAIWGAEINRSSADSLGTELTVALVASLAAEGNLSLFAALGKAKGQILL